MTPALVIAGVSGAGKTTIATIAADELGYRFVDADDLHPEANRRKMASGVPLDDEDRWPWLDLVGAVLHEHDVVVACSALRRRYRDRLRLRCPEVVVILLRPPEEALTGRLALRREHFMPPSLLQSQLDALETLGAEEAGGEVVCADQIDEVAQRVLTAARAASAASGISSGERDG